MQVTIDHEDGNKTAFFGVSDYPGDPDGDAECVDLHLFKTKKKLPDPMEIRGSVERTVSEQAFQREEAVGHIANIVAEEGTSVFAVQTENNQQIINAVEQLKEDGDFEHSDSLVVY